MKCSIDITIPVLNEELRLEKGITETIQFLDKQYVKDYIITIADNGSTDRTEEISNNLINLYPSKIKYIKVSKKGVGLALRTSWPKSDKDIVGYMDVDLATDLKHLIEVLDMFNQNEKVDIVNGSRLLSGSIVEGRKLIREITSRGFNFILKSLLRVNFSDGMCGFKFFRREVAKELIDTGIKTDGWFFCTEILTIANWNNYNIKEIAVNWNDDPNSKVKVISLTLNYLKEILRLRSQKSMWKKK